MTSGRVLVTGASGFLGSALVPALEAGGAVVLRLGRRPSPGGLTWDPAAGSIPRTALEGLDAVVHLAGENIGAGRWSRARRARLLASRVDGTRLLCEALAALERPPRVLVSASAIGYYGDRGSEVLGEESAPGEGFLSGLARAWEGATGPAEARGVRVIHLRMAPVLARDGGMLARMRLPFRLGLGGRLGSGRQWMSWIALDDLIAAMLHVVDREELGGPVNAASPGAVTNREFTRVLGRVLGRPAILPVPAAALRLVFGAMADEALLASARVAPGRLLGSGFRFRYAGLEAALRRALGRPGDRGAPGGPRPSGAGSSGGGS
jgi:uncharacterized protein